LKNQHNKLREEKLKLEKELYDCEYLVKDKVAENQKLRDSFISERSILEDKIADLQNKVAWFREN
jgi:hypothetical protein